MLIGKEKEKRKEKSSPYFVTYDLVGISFLSEKGEETKEGGRHKKFIFARTTYYYYSNTVFCAVRTLPFSSSFPLCPPFYCRSLAENGPQLRRRRLLLSLQRISPKSCDLTADVKIEIEGRWKPALKRQFGEIAFFFAKCHL